MLLLFLLNKLHHPPLLLHLALGQFVLLACVGVVAAFEFDTYRGAVEVEGFAEGFFQVANVVVRDFFGLVTVDDNDGRVVAAGVGVAEFDAPTAYKWRLVGRHCVFENFGEKIGGEFFGRCLISFFERFI